MNSQPRLAQACRDLADDIQDGFVDSDTLDKINHALSIAREGPDALRVLRMLTEYAALEASVQEIIDAHRR